MVGPLMFQKASELKHMSMYGVESRTSKVESTEHGIHFNVFFFVDVVDSNCRIQSILPITRVHISLLLILSGHHVPIGIPGDE